MALVEDFDAFMVDFGEGVTIAGAAQVGIFDKVFQQQFGMVQGSDPVLVIKDSALGSAVEGSAVVVRSVNYTIAAIEPDGYGLTLLQLEAV